MNFQKVIGYSIAFIGLYILWTVNWKIGIGVLVYDVGNFIYEGRRINTYKAKEN